ncbi:DUF2239 family protein [Blastopirellula marina]|uniref:DUF2239 domain-containing protein n=1 Tax=Blastopirellula marina TaxID=124 RepID=A0A2S8GBC4_9BACT|nr:DUF2239 family protein [Blastopirellula marina]PQO41581.1 DUF2239 domain-containing protein [Blastopirellula marina]
MYATARTSCTAFSGFCQIGSGELGAITPVIWRTLQDPEHETVLVFEDETGHQVEVDFRGDLEDVLDRLETAARWANDDTAPPKTRGRGRPKLGVVAREVTLLPRHWQWLDTQPGGASAALRRLVEEAKRASGPADCLRKSQESAYRFMSSMAGDLEGFEEASRALFAGDAVRFNEMTTNWPNDVRQHAQRLGAIALATPTEPDA